MMTMTVESVTLSEQQDDICLSRFTKLLTGNLLLVQIFLIFLTLLAWPRLLVVIVSVF